MAASDPYEIEIVNAPPARWVDLYHQLLRAPWWVDFSLIAAVFVVSNALFALAYWTIGGVANVTAPQQYLYFSVQTMGTIGYGVMYPQTDAANVLVMLESIFGLILTAVFTGLVFAKFSLVRARVRFAGKVAFSPLDGKPTLQIRAGNLRSNNLVEARAHVGLVRTETTQEGVTVYRMYDLKLQREMTQQFSRAWTLTHVVDDSSPLRGATPESLVKEEVEMIITLVGTDDASGQSVHARARYFATDVVFGHRHADMLSDVSPTKMRLDLKYFDELVPTQPIDGFPYPAKGNG
ncbi:MAG: ion channel [Myxococcaceae bacterium]